MNRLILLLILIISFSNSQEATKNNVTKLYIATFNRAPDTQGLNYWVNSKHTLEEIASSFFDQPETKALYPDGYNNYDFILAIYKNLFDREPDQEGGDYWEERLANGGVSKSLFILAIVNGAKGNDATLLNNKTEVGEEFVKSGSNNALIAKDIMQNITTSRQTITDAFNKISNITINGNENMVATNGSIINGNENNVTGDTTTIQYITYVYNTNEITDNTQITEINNPSTTTTPATIEHDTSEVFIDANTGLMWQDDYDAQSVKKPWLTQSNYNAGNYSDTSGDTATTYCDNLSLGGYNDWRLPSLHELKNLYKNKDNLNNLNNLNTYSEYVSSTTFDNALSINFDEGFNINEAKYVFFVDFNNGFYGDGYDKSYSTFVRCVRAGQ